MTDGEHKGAKIFARLTVEGSSDGARTAQSISFGLIGSIVRSAIGVRADYTSPPTEAKLANFSFENLDGIAFIGKTGRIERGKLRDPSQGPNSDRYDDRATLATGVTLDMATDWNAWKNAPRGFALNDSLSGAMAPPNGSGDLGVAIDTPPWGDQA